MGGGREGAACLHRRSTAAVTCTGPSFRMVRRTVGTHVWDPVARAAITRASDRNRTPFAACTPLYSHLHTLKTHPSRRGCRAEGLGSALRLGRGAPSVGPLCCGGGRERQAGACVRAREVRGDGTLFRLTCVLAWSHPARTRLPDPLQQAAALWLKHARDGCQTDGEGRGKPRGASSRALILSWTAVREPTLL